MKRFVKFSIAVASAILAVACNVQEPEAPVVPETSAAEENVIVFTANFEATKAQIGTDGKFTWEAGDVIRITDELGYYDVITLTDDDISDDGSSATLKTTKLSAEANNFYAVYPFDYNTYLNDDKNYVFDNTSLKKSKVLSNVSTCTKDDTSFSFHSASCLIRFDTDIDFAVAELGGPSWDDNVYYQKQYTVSPSTGEVVSIATGGNHFIKYYRETGEDGPYYFEFAPGLTWEKGFVITLFDANEKELASFTYGNSLTTVRGKVYNIKNFDERLDGGDDQTGYVKVTSDLSDWSGEYLLVYESSETKGRCWTGVDAASCFAEATIENGVISTKPDDAVTVTIASMNGGYSIKVNEGVNEGNYIYGKSGSNSIQFGSDAVANEITITDGLATILSNSTSFRYNSQSGNDRFRYYKTTTTGASYICPALYKLVGEPAPAKTLTSIAISGTPVKTAYYVGDAFETAGLVVTGTYDDGSQATISSGITWTIDPETLAAGTTSVSVTATVGELTSQSINVNVTVNTKPITVEFDNLGYESWGKTEQFSGASFDELSQTKDGVTFDYIRNGSSAYANSNSMRFYKANKLIFTAPFGYYISSIEWTGSAFKDDVTTNVKTCTSTTSVLSWTGEASSVTFTRPSGASSYITLESVKITLVAGDVPVINVEGITLDKKTASIEVGETVTLVPTITPADASNKNVTWSSSDEDVAIVDNGIVTGVAVGEATITVTTVDGNKSDECIVNVIPAYTIANTPETAYTASQAIALYDDGKDLATLVYVKGKVTKVTDNVSDYGNADIYVSDGSSEFEFYRCKDLGNKIFASCYVHVGDDVVAFGKLTKYNDTYEFAQGCYLVSYTSNAKKYSVSIADGIQNGSVSADLEEAAEGQTVTLTITPATGYILDELTVAKTTGEPVSVSGNTFVMPASDVTVSATFEETHGDSATFDWSGSSTETKSAEWTSTENGVTLTWNKGTAQNTPSPNKEGSIRMYTGTNVTISAPTGKKVTRIDFTPTTNSYSASNLSYNGKAISDDWTLSSPASPIVLNATANARFKKIIVYFE